MLETFNNELKELYFDYQKTRLIKTLMFVIDSD